MTTHMMKLTGVLAALASFPTLGKATTQHHPNPCLAYQHRVKALGPLDALRGCLHEKCRESDRCHGYKSNHLLLVALERCDDFLLWHCQLPRPLKVSSGDHDFDCDDFVDSEEASDHSVSFLRRHSDWFSYACSEKDGSPAEPDTSSSPAKMQAQELAKAPPLAAPIDGAPLSTTTTTAATITETNTDAPVAVAQEATSSENGGGANATVIGVAVAGGVCALLIAAVLMAVMMKRRKEKGEYGTVSTGRKGDYSASNQGTSGATDTTGYDHKPTSPLLMSPAQDASPTGGSSPPHAGSSPHGAGAPARRVQSAMGVKPLSVVPKPQLHDQLATLQDSPVSSPNIGGDGRPPPVPAKAKVNLALPTSKENVYGDAASAEFSTASSV